MLESTATVPTLVVSPHGTAPPAGATGTTGTPLVVDLAPEALDGDAEGQRGFALARAVALQGAVVLGGIGALFFLLVRLSPGIGPLAVAFVGALLLWPLRNQRVVRGVLLAGGALVGFYLLGKLAGVLAPFVIVWLLAFLLDPLVEAAERRWRVPRWASTLAVTLVFVGLLAAAVFFLVPAIVGQVQTLAGRVVELAARLPEIVQNAEILDMAEEAGLVERQTLVRELGTFLPEQIQALAGRLPRTVLAITRSVGALIGLITTVVLVPVLLFYTLKDYPALRSTMVELFPRYRGGREYLGEVGQVVGGYLRGQLTISIISGVIVAVPLMLFRVPFGLVIGLLAGVLNMIPNLGALLTYVLGATLAFAFGTTGDLVIVLIVLAAQAFLEQTVLTPNIMGKQTGLHPVLIMLSLFVFGAFLGLLGLFVAVPATALLVALYRSFRESFVLDVGSVGRRGRLVVAPSTSAASSVGSPTVAE